MHHDSPGSLAVRFVVGTSLVQDNKGKLQSVQQVCVPAMIAAGLCLFAVSPLELRQGLPGGPSCQAAAASSYVEASGSHWAAWDVVDCLSSSILQVPEEEREVYEKGQHLRNADAAMAEQACNELVRLLCSAAWPLLAVAAHLHCRRHTRAES